MNYWQHLCKVVSAVRGRFMANHFCADHIETIAASHVL